MAELVLGPAVRYVSDTEANVWLEVDGPCQAAILDQRASTFCVNGHHYALAEFNGREPGRTQPSPAPVGSVRPGRDAARPAREELAAYAEYPRLYSESWLDPAMRWFLSTVSTSMIWDDHDVHDDWNTSLSWLEAMRAKPWWEKR